MEDVININEYVRTTNKGIKKIDHLNINPNATINKYRYFLGIDEDGNRCYGTIKTTEIVKHSKNIIDLIEIGDYVNGKEVKHIAYFEGIEKPIRKIIFVDEHRLVPGETAENDDIKSIVTKEQFKEMEYEL